MESKSKLISDYIQNCMPRIIEADGDIFAAFEFMKRLPAAWMIKKAIDRNEISENTHVIETSSGTLAVGLAEVCNLLSIPCHIVSDPAIRGVPEFLSLQQDAKLYIIDEPDESGNYQQKRLEKIEVLKKEFPDHFVPNQYHNPDNAEAYSIAVDHLIRITKKIPDCVICTVGSGGSSRGIISALKVINSSVIGIGVDTPGSVLLGDTNRRRELRGLGNSLIPRNLDANSLTRRYWVHKLHAVDGTFRLYKKLKILCGLTSGAAYLAYLHQKSLDPEKCFLTVFPDIGYRYMNELTENQEKSSASNSPLQIRDVNEIDHTSKNNWYYQEVEHDHPAF